MSFMGIVVVVATAGLLSLSPQANASDNDKADRGALATLEVSASKEVLQDEVRVVFSAQANGKAAADVNRALSQMLDKARAGFTIPAGVEVSTGGFSVYLDYGKENKPKGWAGRSSLVVVSKDLAAVSSVIEHFGKTLALSSVNFSLSRQARLQQEKSLMQELADQFGARAALTAQAFGYKNYEVVELDFIGGGDYSPRPMMQRISAAPVIVNTGPSVTLEPPMTTVEISVAGQIRLHH